MSHISVGETPITDLDVLESAALELGFTVERNALCRLYYSHQNYTSELVIKGKGMAFDIGVEKQKDGTYRLVTDFYGRSVQKACGRAGHNLGDLVEMYGVHAIEKLAKKKKLKFKRERKEDKTIVKVYA